jgi:hypothetical protein
MTFRIPRLRRKPRCEHLNRNIMPIYVPKRAYNPTRLADGTSAATASASSATSSSSPTSASPLTTAMADDYDDDIDAEGELDEDGDGPAAAATPGGPPVRRRRPVVGLTPAQRRSAIRRSNAAAGTQQRRTLATMAFLLRGHLPPSPPLRQRRNIPPLPLPTPPAAAAAVPPELSLPDLPPHSRPRTYVMRPPSPGNMDLALPPLRPMSDAPPPPASGVLPTLQAPPRAPALPELRAPLPLPSHYPAQQTPPQQQGPPTATTPSAPPNAAPPMRPAMSPPTNSNPPAHFLHMQPGIPAPPPFMTGGLMQWPPMTMAPMPNGMEPPMLAGFPMMPPVPAMHAMPPLLADPLVTASSIAQAGTERDILHLLRLEQQPAAEGDVLTGGSAASAHSHGHGHGRPAAPPALDGLEYFEPEDIGERGVPRLNRPRHTRFVRAALTARFPHAFVGLDASRPWLMYWGLTASSVLGVDVTEHRGR